MRARRGETLETDASSVGGGGPVIIPCNWLQHYENLMDTLNVPILHGAFSGPQFTDVMGLMPEVTWEETDRGVKAVSVRRLPDGRVFHRVSEAVLPTLRVIPAGGKDPAGVSFDAGAPPIVLEAGTFLGESPSRESQPSRPSRGSS